MFLLFDPLMSDRPLTANHPLMSNHPLPSDNPLTYNHLLTSVGYKLGYPTKPFNHHRQGTHPRNFSKEPA